MFVVDTNILVYAVNRDAPERRPCRELLESWRPSPHPWFVTWGILYEFLRVTTHARVFRHPLNAQDAWDFVESLLASPGLGILAPTSRHAEIAGLLVREVQGLSGNVMHDLTTAVLMREHGIRTIYTHDRDFRSFPLIEVIDPIRAERPPRDLGEPRARRTARPSRLVT